MKCTNRRKVESFQLPRAGISLERAEFPSRLEEHDADKLLLNKPKKIADDLFSLPWDRGPVQRKVDRRTAAVTLGGDGEEWDLLGQMMVTSLGVLQQPADQFDFTRLERPDFKF